MKPFEPFTGRAISLPEDNVDTDIIYPARFLLITEKTGLGRYAFADRRTGGDTRFDGDDPAPILVAGANFGCGSSREQAVWSLADLGIRVILAPSYGEIFRSNCANNGLLAAVVLPDVAAVLHAAAEAGEPFTVDLVACTVTTPDSGTHDFEIPGAARELLLNGWNETTRILALYGEHITQFEREQQRHSPWLWASEIQDGDLIDG